MKYQQKNTFPLVLLLLRATAAGERQGCSFATELAQQCQCRFSGDKTIQSLAASTFLDLRFKHLDFDFQVQSAQQ